MVVISEIPDDGSNDGDPNKNPKELQKNPQEDDENQSQNSQEDDENQSQNSQKDDENQNENPQEDDENQNENQQEVVNLRRALPVLPQDIIASILARVRRCCYPPLSLTSKAFGHLMTSQRLYDVRLNSGLTESILYVLIAFTSPYPRWYILYRNNLRQISSMPPMFPGCAVVTIGHNMYVMGGRCVPEGLDTESVYLIDCRFHTREKLPNMHRARCRAAAGVIDGKIYVIGGCEKRFDDEWVEVFDVKTRIWTTMPGLCTMDTNLSGEFMASVVMQEKIYMMDPSCCLTYKPTQPHWGIESDQLKDHWYQSACVVIDHLLYTIDPYHFPGHLIVVYDPNDKLWRPVKGEHDLPDFVYYETKLVNFDGKLTIVGPTWSYQSPYHDVCCVEIALEKREGNEIWGEVVSKELVLFSEKSPSIHFCSSVTV